jgi:MFS family permease
VKLRFRRPDYAWRLVGVLSLAAAVNYGDRTAITTVFPLLRRDLGMSDVALGATGSLFLWSYALLSPLAGYAGDRFSRSRLITWSLLAWSAVTLLTGLAPTAAVVLAMRVCLGIAESVYMPAAATLIADYHNKTRATAMGIHTSGYSVGMVSGAALAGYLGEHYGWRASLFVLGGFGLGLGWLCTGFLRDQPRTTPAMTVRSGPAASFGTAIGAVVRVPSYLVLVAQSMLASVASWVFITWLPLYFFETFRLSLAQAGVVGTFWVQAGMILGTMAGGILSDRVARYGVRHRMLLQSAWYCAAAPFAIAFLWSHSLRVIAAAVFCLFLLRSLGISNEQPLIAELLPESLRATAIGTQNLMSCVAGGAGVLLAGYLKTDVGLARLFGGVSLLFGAAALLLLAGYLLFARRDLQARQATEAC